MLKLDITRKAKKFLDRLDAKQFRQISRKIFSLMENPNQHDTHQLAGYEYKRADQGEYRIIYRVEGDCLMVALIGKRNDDEVYKKLKRG